MITSLSLKHFKSVSNNHPIQFKNLSVICGSNSSGKSSILQSILMLSQTFSSRYLKKTVSLNGKLVRLGSFTDILNHTCKTDERFIDIAIELQFSKNSQSWLSTKKLSLKYTFANISDNNKKFEGEFHPEIIRGEIALGQSSGGNYDEYIKFSSQEPGRTNPELFSVLDLESANKSEIAKEHPDYKIEGVSRQDLIPNILHLNYDLTKKLSQTLVPFLIGTPNYLKTVKEDDQKSLETSEIPKALLDKIKSMISAEIEDQTKNFKIPEEIINLLDASQKVVDREHIRKVLAEQAISLAPDLISIPPLSESLNIIEWRAMIARLSEKERKALFDFLIRNRDTIQGVWYANMKKTRAKATYEISALEHLNLFGSFIIPRHIKYLGPLRNEPQAMYQAFDLSEPTLVGLKGENTAAVLHINKGVKIHYTLAVETADNKIDFIKKFDTLGVACTEWLTYLGVVTEFQTSDKGKLGYEILVKTTTDDRLQDLTHVGVGVSQILPIVVMALLSEDDDILIFEQPELHLHPKVQSRLTDFFLAISSGAKQCLIETHSEYVINRLRLRIAQSRNENLRANTNVIFVGKKEKNSEFQSVDITSFGSIIDWPEDFFDQTDKEVENILLEAVAKKREIKNLSNLKAE
ncbi:DUF3696 domain-containing protein [Pseudomonas sp. B21-031]|uniref:DUF3696 domain-containing protein n=1 Tax=Pseudomonas sp. B21-031 TaxID=2895482 RepID=UPI00215F0971|nr:DUF3696 domain-containing protein [Pseudomonas sp. B21-031]